MTWSLPSGPGRRAHRGGVPRPPLPRRHAVRRRRLHRRGPVLRALGVPGHQRDPQRDRRAWLAAARPLLRTAGPPPAAGRGRGHRRDRRGVRAHHHDRPAARPWWPTPRARSSTTPTGTSSASPNDYFATDVDRSPFLHFWSLADRGAVLRRLPGPCSGAGRAGPPPRLAGPGRDRHAAGALRGVAALLDGRRPQPRLLRHRRPALPAAGRLAARGHAPAPGSTAAGRRGWARSASPASWSLAAGCSTSTPVARVSSRPWPVSRSSRVVSAEGRQLLGRAAALPAGAGLPRQDLLRDLPLALAGAPGAAGVHRGPPDRPGRHRWRHLHRPRRAVLRGVRDADPALGVPPPLPLDGPARRGHRQRPGRAAPDAADARGGPPSGDGQCRGTGRDRRHQDRSPGACRPRLREGLQGLGPRAELHHPRGLHRGQGRRAERGPGRRQPRPHAGAGLREDRRGAGLPAGDQHPHRVPVAGRHRQLQPPPGRSARTASSSVGTGTTRSCPA